jgi:hypothetical protein
MIPVKMGEEDMNLALTVSAGPFHKFGTERPNSRSTIDDDLRLRSIHFDAGSVSAESSELPGRKGIKKRFYVFRVMMPAGDELLEYVRDSPFDLEGRQRRRERTPYPPNLNSHS